MLLLSKDFWEVKKTTKKGKGVFAKKDIPAGIVLGDYLGTLVQSRTFDEAKYGLYDMYFNDDISILPDTQTVGVHTINHSCGANCDMYPYKGHTLYFTSRYIFAGEELTVQYLLPPPQVNHICNHICYCATPICHGTMHTSIGIEKITDTYIQKKDGEYRKNPPVRIGELLPILDTYPKNIEDDPICDTFGSTTHKPYEYLDTIFPSIKQIRSLIREKGRRIYMRRHNIIIYGIMNEIVLIQSSVH